jgi:predicted RNA-binding protein YlxR (DUF448 family)
LKKRRLPLRTCIGCQQQKNKRDLIRVVRTPIGQVELDPTGKKAGRGTYLCRQRSCFKVALDAKRIERSLKHPVSPDVMKLLTEQLPDGDGDAE